MKIKSSMWYSRIVSFLILGILVISCNTENKKLSRGIGIYPGNPDEDFSPELKVENKTYRNLAYLRSAFHSSSYDYNLTAQLITDGIYTNKVPNYISLTTSQGVVPKNERELVIDHVTGSATTVEGNNVWLKFLIGGDDIPEITSIAVNGKVTYDEKGPTGWDFKVSGSNDGNTWEILGQANGSGLPGFETPNPFAAMMKDLPKDSTGKAINPFAGFFGSNDPNEPKPSFTFNFPAPVSSRTLAQVFKFKKPVNYRIYKVDLNSRSGKSWEIGDFDFFNNDNPVEMAPSYKFISAWMSAGFNEEWVYVDLGSVSTFDLVKLFWINKPKSGTIQISNDAEIWADVAELPGSGEKTDRITLKKGAVGRYVRVLMNKRTGKVDNFVLSEMEVMGKGGLVVVPKTQPPISGTRMNLAGGDWKIQRASEVSSTGEIISNEGFDVSEWVTATVPGTALVSYWNAGAIPDPNYADNQLMISESFFNSDFWYHNEFDVPTKFKDERMILNFDGINWKADIFVNGKKLGKIEGAFIQGKFDVTDLIIPGQKNVVAVLIKKNDNVGCITEQTATNSGKNGGILGADNPTFHASVGWDWIPTIRGRNIGIWNDVYLTTNGGVTIENPFLTTDMPLPDTTYADINIEVQLQNHLSKAVVGKLTGKFGNISFEEKVSLGASESKNLKLTPASHPELHFKNPKLWWPVGYGQPNLYDVELKFVKDDGSVSDKESFKSGVREMAFDETNRILNIYINGRRLIGRGGNWGFPESNLEYRGREYDIAVGYHADMNFTMIRNWVGQTGDDEFFEACDRYGVTVWQDFWLANPVDGPNPYNPEMFLDNAKDMIKRIRNHPSVAIYVGRNEGNPPPVIDTVLRRIIPELHPGIHYISNSSMGTVSGGGPYNALPVRDYFLLYGRDKLHSERGMPNVMNYESMKLMLPEIGLWPQNSLWGLHDYCLEGAQRTATFNQMVEKGFGKVEDAEKFAELAQWINYDGYRAMFEGRSQYRQGLLLWMSHPAWPSMVWQTYDYYLDPTAAYFGCKKASEPIHIQWNPVYDEIEVVNLNAWDQKGLTAKVQLINMDGSVKWEKEVTIDSKEDSTVKIFKLEFPESLSSVHFIKLILMKGDKLLSDNFYWRGLDPGNYQALYELAKVSLKTKTSISRRGDKWVIETRLKNSTDKPALMVRLLVAGDKSGERILPALYSDNYFSLMPGETKTILMSVKDEDSRSEKPVVKISGFNL